MKHRLNAKAYAAERGVSENTVGKWCTNSMLAEADRNQNLPPIVARKVGTALGDRPGSDGPAAIHQMRKPGGA